MLRTTAPGPRIFLFSLLGLWAVACPEGATLDNAQDHHAARRGEGCDARPIFEERCSGGICHGENGAEGPAGGVDLVSPGVEGRLFGMAATYRNVENMADCPTTPELLINPNNPEASLLLTKIFNTHSCGDGMPIPNPPGLPESEQECIRKWVFSVIENGDPGGGGLGGAPGTGGTTGAAGDTSTGGMSSVPETLRIQAECAFGAMTGDCSGQAGSNMGPMLEDADTKVGYFDTGMWLSYSGVDLSGFTKLTFRYAKEALAGTIEVRLGSSTGTLLGTFTPALTGSWTDYQEASITFEAATGSQDVYLVSTGDGVLNLDWIEFSAD